MQYTLRTRAPLRLSTLLIAATVFGVPASAQSPNASGVTVYADPNFGGQSATFVDDTPTLVPSGMNDTIASIRIPDGEAWEVCQDIDYVGKCQVLSSSATDLGSIGWNDQISSLRRVDKGAFALAAYANANYAGERLLFGNDTPTLATTTLNDRISSIEIPAGETWEVCQEIDYGQPCQVLSSSVPDLSSMQWAGRISSLRRTSTVRVANASPRPDGTTVPDIQQSLLFFSQAGFAGTSESFVSGKSQLGFHAREGSIKVIGGGTWELCDRRRRCAIVNADVPDISTLRLNGRITTARPVDASERTPR